MSLMDTYGQKQLLPRRGPDEFWAEIEQSYAKDDRRVWHCLAMLALHESVGWTLDQIGVATGLHRGQISRCIEETKRDLRTKFRDGRRFHELEPGFSDPDQP